MNSFSLGKSEVTWSQDSASDHRSAQTLAAGFELFCHSPHSPFVFVLHGKWPVMGINYSKS